MIAIKHNQYPTLHQPLDFAIILLAGKPLVAHELKLLVGLKIPDNDGSAVPGGIIATSRVVVPNPEVL